MLRKLCTIQLPLATMSQRELSLEKKHVWGTLVEGTLDTPRKPAVSTLGEYTALCPKGMWVAEESRVTVTDLNSTNGTYINETELEPMKTTDIPLGAEVTFGEPSFLQQNLQAVGVQILPRVPCSLVPVYCR